jgi:RND family efflux transporter MFP subunit
MLRRAEAAIAGAKANLMQAQVMQTRASRELERMKELKESGLATRQALDDARTGEEAEGARVAAAAAQISAAEEEMRQIRLRLAKGLVTAPIDGVVSERRVNVGDLVGEAGANQPLFHIVDNSVLNLSVSAPSAALAALRRGQTIEFMTDAFPGRTFLGKIKYINPSVGNTDRSVRVMAEVHNGTGELKGGLFVKGRVITKRREGVVLVPRDSLLSWNVAGGTASIYVVEKERARRREVRTGAVDGGGVEIVSGLKSGEQYVVRGAFNVRNDDRLLITSGKPGVEK